MYNSQIGFYLLDLSVLWHLYSKQLLLTQSIKYLLLAAHSALCFDSGFRFRLCDHNTDYKQGPFSLLISFKLYQETSEEFLEIIFIVHIFLWLLISDMQDRLAVNVHIYRVWLCFSRCFVVLRFFFFFF